MSTIRRFFNQSIVISRLKATSGRKRAFSATATVEGHIQSLDLKTKQILGILEERAWKAWFPVDSDIKEQDKLVDNNGIRYDVRELVKKEYGINQHLEVILEEQSA